MAEKGVQTLDRALNVLELLAVQKNGMGVTEIGQQVGLHKSTVHRLLGALASRGYVEKDAETGMYKIGLKVVEIASLHLNSIELKTEASPYLHTLAAISTQPVHLATLMDGEVVYIEKVDTVTSIRMYSHIGRRVPAHCSGVGRALYLDYSDAELMEIFKNYDFTAYTPNTATNLGKFIQRMGQARKLGYVIDDEEHEPGIRCIAAPIRDYRGKIIASVSTSGDKTIISPERDEELAAQVLRCADEISRRMGYTM